VPTGAALTTTMRRTWVARIAATMARVPREVMPASVLGLRGGESGQDGVSTVDCGRERRSRAGRPPAAVS
jgi:hypothetical protein